MLVFKKIDGFTLIEIMVVVVILGILAALVVPSIMDKPDEARLVKAKYDIQRLETALKMYKLDNHFYPSTEQGLEALTSKPNGVPEPRQWKRYLDRLPDDPWGFPYNYLYPGQQGEIDIYSLGADGQLGGTGVNADIGNWNIE